MKKQMTVLGMLGILTCLSFTNAQAQIFVDVVVASPVCHPKVIYQQAPSCHGHYKYHRGHHHHGNDHHYRQQCAINNNGRGNYKGNGRGHGHHR